MATKRTPNLTPRSVGERELLALRQELSRMLSALVETEPIGRDADKARLMLATADRLVKGYRRETQLALHGVRLGGSGRFEDHDQFASMVLYLWQRFQGLQSYSGSLSPHHFLKHIRELWHNANPDAAGDFDPIMGEDEPAVRARPLVGVVTVLEHEYQSILRRLDRIYACSDDEAYGFALLDRVEPAQDLKEACCKGAEPLAFGWADGLVGDSRILVVCNGKPGQKHAKEAISAVQKMVIGNGIPVKGWLLVGVCAGTSTAWPVGTVLVSQGAVAGVSKSHSNKYKRDSLIEPMVFKDLPGAHQLESLYRRAPHGAVKGVAVASPCRLGVRAVKFACTPHVVNDEVDREKLRSFLVEEGVLLKGEEFGIEMEGAGADVTKGDRMAVIKGVCDYADASSKGGGWDSGVKQIFQLYAAEAAADVALRLVQEMTAATG